MPDSIQKNISGNARAKTYKFEGGLRRRFNKSLRQSDLDIRELLPRSLTASSDKMATRQLVDSHVHLYELDHIHSLAWMTSASPLQGQHSIAEYIKSTEPQSSPSNASKQSPRQLLGFIFVEVDRINNPPSKLEGWRSPLQEYSFVASISLGLIPKYVKYSALLLGIIPWAPLPYGSLAMQQYERELCALHSEPALNCSIRPYKVKGFRYLLQDLPRRTMLGARFLESLRWMGRRGYVFECTIDCREGQLWQLEEAIEMMGRVNRQVARDEDLVQVVISEKACPLAMFRGAKRANQISTGHLTKPDFSIDPTSCAETHSYHKKYISLVDDLSRFPNVAIKFSGGFSQLPEHFQRLPAYPAPASEEDIERWIDEVAHRLSPWTSRIYNCFGSKRVIWGSDWPVCNVVGGRNAFELWERVTERLLSDAGISECDQEGFWWENARRIYKTKTDEREPSRI